MRGAIRASQYATTIEDEDEEGLRDEDEQEQWQGDDDEDEDEKQSLLGGGKDDTRSSSDNDNDNDNDNPAGTSDTTTRVVSTHKQSSLAALLSERLPAVHYRTLTDEGAGLHGD